MKREKNAFTLIELIAVLVIIGIIALIAVPNIIDVIAKSRDKANLKSAYNIVEAARTYYVDESEDEDKIFDGQVNYLDIIKMTGDKPDSGYVYLDYEGEVSLAALYGNKCYTKNFFEETVTSSDNKDDCLAKETLKDKLESLPTKEVNINGEVVNKVYGDKIARTSMNNYVWFSGNLWQVIEVNENDVKLVTSMPVTSITYGSDSNYDTSWVKKWLEQRFYPTLEDKNLIVKDNFCSDTITAETTSVVQDASYTIQKISSHNKINSCLMNTNANIGLLSFEDYVYANNAETPVYDTANFISGDELEWTMSPYNDSKLWVLWYRYNLEYITTTETYFSKAQVYGHGVRPVISIKNDVLVTSGTGKNYDPFLLSTESILAKDKSVSNVKIGNYVYLDESNNPNKFDNERVSKDVNYNTTKDKVRYRVIEKNNDFIKLQRSDILKNLSTDVSIKNNYKVPFYYYDKGDSSTWCSYINSTWYGTGCIGNNIFDDENGTGDYNYKDGENIGYFLNNADNSFYSWFSNKTKEMLKPTTFKLYTGGYSKDYSNMDNNSNSVYPMVSNDGIITVNVGLPSWGEMYAGNDLNFSYWLINRGNNSNYHAAYVSADGYTSAYYPGTYDKGVRPVVSLKPSVKIESGEGTMMKPYTLK